MNKHFAILLLAAFTLAGACESDPFGGSTPSFFRATLDGAVEAQYEGTGTFHTGTPGPGRQQFQVVSDGTGASSNQLFSFTRWDGGQLAEGVYPIALVDVSGYDVGVGPVGQPRGITVQYRRTVENWSEHFVAQSGTLEITRSTRDRIEGRFQISGFRFCAEQVIRSNPPALRVGPCALPAVPIEDAPVITVNGSFAAVPSPHF